jgi:hypothetical protein
MASCNDTESNDSVSDTAFDLVDAAFLYLTESKYPPNCSESRKRGIRKKAKMFVVYAEGVLYFKKKKKGKVMFVN